MRPTNTPHAPAAPTCEANGCGGTGCGWYTARGTMSGMDRLAL